jgi:hypothetical protein
MDAARIAISASASVRKLRFLMHVLSFVRTSSLA